VIDACLFGFRETWTLSVFAHFIKNAFPGISKRERKPDNGGSWQASGTGSIGLSNPKETMVCKI